MFVVNGQKAATSFRLQLTKEQPVLLPVKFIAANIFVAGMTAGVAGGAAVVYILSDAERRDKLKDCAEKVGKTCKNLLNSKPDAGSFE